MPRIARAKNPISSSATAPATAAIGVMNCSRCGQHASTIRRATGPRTEAASCTGERSSFNSPTSSVSTVWKRIPGALHRDIDGSFVAVGTDDEIDRTMGEMPAAVREAGARRALRW